MGRLIISKTVMGIVLLTLISFVFSQEQEYVIPMTATIDIQNNVIMVSGALTQETQGNVVKVVIPDVPAGRWTVIKSEVNLTDTPWENWDIGFLNPNLTLATVERVSSGQFTDFSWNDEGGVLSFSDGRPVVPGEAVLKVFEVELLESGIIDMAHHRNSSFAERALGLSREETLNLMDEMSVQEYILEVITLQRKM